MTVLGRQKASGLSTGRTDICVLHGRHVSFGIAILITTGLATVLGEKLLSIWLDHDDARICTVIQFGTLTLRILGMALD